MQTSEFRVHTTNYLLYWLSNPNHSRPSTRKPGTGLMPQLLWLFSCYIESYSFVTTWTVHGIFQAFPSPGDLPNTGIKPVAPAMSPALQVVSLWLTHGGNPLCPQSPPKLFKLANPKPAYLPWPFLPMQTIIKVFPSLLLPPD